ncbi:MAG: DUF3619 family protein [Limnohabitans sp.]|nr:DUF3619 family protein [Limnohabitans sp.]
MKHTAAYTPTASDLMGRKIAAQLDQASNQLSYDISERLRAARMRAVAACRQEALQTQTAPQLQNQNGVLVATPRFKFWNGLASLLPLVALVVGLFVIQSFHSNQRAFELAEVDSALLIDDLPPNAYIDSGFLQFLKLQAQDSNEK